MLWAWFLPFHGAAFVSPLLTEAYVSKSQVKAAFHHKRLRKLFPSVKVPFQLYVTISLTYDMFWHVFKLDVILDTQHLSRRASDQSPTIGLLPAIRQTTPSS
jgi:hypothetical protein